MKVGDRVIHRKTGRRGQINMIYADTYVCMEFDTPYKLGRNMEEPIEINMQFYRESDLKILLNGK